MTIYSFIPVSYMHNFLFGCLVVFVFVLLSIAIYLALKLLVFSVLGMQYNIIFNYVCVFNFLVSLEQF